MDKVPLTLNGFESLNEELKHLKSNERPNIIRAISEGFSSSREYLIIKNEDPQIDEVTRARNRFLICTD